MRERVADDRALTVNEILDLMDTLAADVLMPSRPAVLRAVLCWGARHELFTMAGLIEAPAADEAESGRAAAGDAAPGTPAAPSSTAAEGLLPPDDARWSRDGARGNPDRTPAGPQVGPGDQAGASFAEPPSGSGQGPEGAEACHAEADDAPVPPVAGGGTSSPKTAPPVAGGGTSSPKTAPPVAGGGTSLSKAAPPVAGGGTALPPEPPARFARWTREEEERAVTLRLAGKTYPEMAAILGRPYRALEVKFSTRLNAICDARRRAEAAGDRAETPALASVPDDGPLPCATALARSQDGAPLWFRTTDAALNALGHLPPFTPAGDLALVERLARGEKLGAIAAEMGIARGALKARFIALTPDGAPVGRDQERLLAVLRHRAGVEPAREAAE